MQHVLVTGGAGYIGSHMVKMLLAAGHRVTVFDDLSTGYGDAVVGGELVVGSLGDTAALAALFGGRRFDAVMHFASSMEVAESVRDPAKYYRNNVVGSLNLFDAMVLHGVKQAVFSSSAAIFGEPRYTPMDEAHPACPVNPYGRSKWMVEQALEDYDRAFGLRAVALRYFNAAGADPAGTLGERHEPETHLIPLVLQAASGRRAAITIFGDDYDTPDGTCIRDYVHVEDLCQAHLLALRHLAEGAGSARYNLGSGVGFSVREVIDTAQRVTGRKIPVVRGARRPGDPARLVADAQLARHELGWQPQHGALATMVEHAWRWEQTQFGRTAQAMTR